MSSTSDALNLALMENFLDELVGYGILLAECETHEVSFPKYCRKQLTQMARSAMLEMTGGDVSWADAFEEVVDVVCEGQLAASRVPK